MFEKITMIDYARPLTVRAKARKSTGPYTWTPTEPGKGRGFYQSGKRLAMDERGSSFALRLELANDCLESYSRLKQINGYYCDEFGDQTLIPIVARLPHSRGFLAGWTMGEGMAASLDSFIHADAEEAALAAHDQAERDAEKEREYQASEEANEIFADDDTEESTF